MTRTMTLCLLVLLAASPPARGASTTIRLPSPDGRTLVTIDAGGGLRWSVARDGAVLVAPSAIGMSVNGRQLGAGAVRSVHEARADRTIDAVFYPRRRVVHEHYDERTIVLDDGLVLRVRAFDDGVAYRLETDLAGTIRVDGETVALALPGNPTIYAPLADCAKAAERGGADCFHTSFEETYTVAPLDSFPRDRQAFLPVLVDGGQQRPKLLVSESDLDDYPGLWLRTAGDRSGLSGVFAAYPLQEEVVGEEFPQAVVVKRAPYIAETTGRRTFPWRVVAIADRDADLPANDIVYRLGGETAPGDWSWLRGGKSQSEWLWDNILYDVPFVSGLNTATYRYYLDFARRFGTGYLFFDAGWSAATDPLSITPGLDVPGLVRDARAQGLGVVLWHLALAVERGMEAVMDQLQRWGATGIMVDFMDRDDQKTVQFYRRVVEEAARRHLIVNFHGAYKPTGLERRFPNAVTREGVIASEHDKWSTVLTPEYEVTLPFIRGVVGPIDYEPGHMRNAQQDAFKPMGALPMTQGTRMHQAAMYLVYESPYAKMGGNVSDYLREPAFTTMLASIPTLWQETRVLDGRVADYVVILREAADGSYWIGALTDWTPRDLMLPLAFLPAGAFTADVWQDGPNAHRYGADWQHVEWAVSARDTLPVHLAPGGGVVVHLHRRADPTATDRPTRPSRRRGTAGAAGSRALPSAGTRPARALR